MHTTQLETVAPHRAIEPLLNEFDVARLTGMSVSSVRRWRLLRKGPKYLKICGGSAVRYKREDISAWLEACPAGGAGVKADSSAQLGGLQ